MRVQVPIEVLKERQSHRSVCGNIAMAEFVDLFNLSAESTAAFDAGLEVSEAVVERPGAGLDRSRSLRF